jgi:hypothetical protein
MKGGGHGWHNQRIHMSVKEMQEKLASRRAENLKAAMESPVAALAKSLAPYFADGLPSEYERDDDSHTEGNAPWTWTVGDAGELVLHSPTMDEDDDVHVIASHGFLFAWLACRAPYDTDPGSGYIFKDVEALAYHVQENFIDC